MAQLKPKSLGPKKCFDPNFFKFKKKEKLLGPKKFDWREKNGKKRFWQHKFFGTKFFSVKFFLTNFLWQKFFRGKFFCGKNNFPGKRIFLQNFFGGGKYLFCQITFWRKLFFLWKKMFSKKKISKFFFPIFFSVNFFFGEFFFS